VADKAHSVSVLQLEADNAPVTRVPPDITALRVPAQDGICPLLNLGGRHVAGDRTSARNAPALVLPDATAADRVPPRPN
jgi:hypothetical protein